MTLAPDNAPLGHRTRLSCGPMWTIEKRKETLNFAASSTLPARELTPAVCHAGPCVRPKKAR
jgi:hypothetical protein